MNFEPRGGHYTTDEIFSAAEKSPSNGCERARDRTPKNGYIHKQLAPSCLHNKLEEPISRACGGARVQTDRQSPKRLRRESANERTCFSTCTVCVRRAYCSSRRRAHILQFNLAYEIRFEYYMNENRFRFLSSFSPHVNGVLLLVAAILWLFFALHPSPSSVFASLGRSNFA